MTRAFRCTGRSRTSIREAIRAGRLARGSSLPPTRVLASDLGVSRGVVVEAYLQLGAEGYLASAAGGGAARSSPAGLAPAPAGPPAGPASPPSPVAIDLELRAAPDRGRRSPAARVAARAAAGRCAASASETTCSATGPAAGAAAAAARRWPGT